MSISQVTRIRRHLLRGNTITQRSALLDFGIMALPRRIADLKESGFPIETTMESNNATGQRFAMYRFKRTVDHVNELIPGCTYQIVSASSVVPFARGAVERTDGHFTVSGVNTSESRAVLLFGQVPQFLTGDEFLADKTIKYVGGLT